MLARNMPRPQAAFLATVVSADPKRALCDALVRRLDWWRHRSGGGDEEWRVAMQFAPKAVDRMSRTALAFRVAFVRSISNGWVTTERSHGATQSCMFGSQAPDGLLHYSECAILWGRIEECTQLAAAPSRLGRLGLARASSAFAKRGRFRTPTVPVFQLAVAVDATHRARTDDDPRASLRSRVRDAVRRLTPS